ncbi:MAG: FkbM family methyltransferase [Bacteroidota bacterium]
MKLFGRYIVVGGMARKLLQLVKTAIAIYGTCKQPSKVLGAYIFKKKLLSTIVLRNGMVVHLSNNKNDIVTFVLVFCRKEYGTMDTYKTVVDIGANIGLFSLYAASRGCEKIIAVEPNTVSYATLVKNIEANNLQNTIVPMQMAVSDISGDRLFIPKDSDPENIAVELVSAQQQDNYESVETISLTNLIKIKDLQLVNMLKMDCEGAEFKILLPMQESELRGIGNIVMEYHHEPQPLIDHLTNNGFSIRRFKQVINTRIKVGIIEASRNQP